jgi:hypothetical protein
VAERYAPGLTLSQVVEDAARLRETVRGLRMEGRRVRHVSSTFLASEETVLDLLEADSPADLEELDRRSSVKFDRVSAAVVVWATSGPLSLVESGEGG